MKKFKKLTLKKIKVAELTLHNTKGGIDTHHPDCNDTTLCNITIGIDSCVDGICRNKTYEFNNCTDQTIETRTGDSLGSMTFAI